MSDALRLKHLFYIAEISSETTSTVSINFEIDSTSTLTSETTPPSEMSLIVVVAIVAATLLLLAIFILILTLVVCCFLYNRNKKVLNQSMLTMTRGSQENRPSASEPQLQQIMSNPAYDVCDGLDSNPAYNNNSQFINVSNPAYNVSRDQTQTEPYYSVIRS